MRASPAQTAFLDQILPFGGFVTADGSIEHLAPALKKAVGETAVELNFFDLFRVRSPRSLRKSRSITDFLNERVSVDFLAPGSQEPLVLRLHVCPTPNTPDLFVFNSSFGVHLSKAVDLFGLTERDFSPADPSVDLLYVMKTQSALLADSQAMATRLKEAKDAAMELALTDPLTGLPNRRALARHLETVLVAGHPGERLAVVHVDLDHFKRVNDTLGHAAGDEVLGRVSAILSRAVGEGGMATRIGGDEFVLLVPIEDDSQIPLLEMARDLIRTISRPVMIAGYQAQISASIGITFARAGEKKSVDDVLLEADLALYEVKTNGRGRVHFYDTALSSRQALVQSLTRDLEPAIASGQFEPFYQVQVDALTGKVYGAEVLARWRHPIHGLLTPATFLVISERSRLTEKIDNSILTQALDHFVQWKAHGLELPHLCFNITADKLSDVSFLETLQRETQARDIDPSEVMIELMESILIDGGKPAIRKATEDLADAGFRLALDDFGTGHASIASLIAVPVHLVKIDRSFVTGIDQDSKRQMLTQAIVSLAAGLRLEVLAEGVETPEEAQTLTRLGCWKFQGYLFSRPVPPEDFHDLLKQTDWATFCLDCGLEDDWPTHEELLRHVRLAGPQSAAS
ncbi:putative bifunctional diguanylate cyclase/phosphodiesterase [Oceanicaulis sp. LC35]|uniref:putative bifunctional diguanylate cyclase/phosphodiesterase n=1 Tax=Oceanicaulis sp. LC35 TaxID=3349635 RepID=UPI003F855482